SAQDLRGIILGWARVCFPGVRRPASSLLTLPSGQAPRLSSPSRPYRPEKGGDMIDRFFGDPNVLLRLRSGPLGPYVDGVCRLLVEQDYAEYSVRLRLRLLGVLSQWLGRHGLVVVGLGGRKNAQL